VILSILAIAAVVILLAIVFYSLWYLHGDWRQEHGYRAYVRRTWGGRYE
jgi:NADH:ubiquinone oxidoreductase subunit 5 (subunit L)/multisubunit Na+/H+ antiporter MnhA subunit